MQLTVVLCDKTTMADKNQSTGVLADNAEAVRGRQCSGVPYESDKYPGNETCSNVLPEIMHGLALPLCSDCLALHTKYRHRNKQKLPTKRRAPPVAVHSDPSRAPPAAVHPHPQKGRYRLHYFIDTIANTLHKLDINDNNSILLFAQRQDFSTRQRDGDVSGPDPDAYAVVSEPSHCTIFPVIVRYAKKICPIFLRPFFEEKVHRMLVNKITKGTAPHRDGWDKNKGVYIHNMLTVVVHVSDDKDLPMQLLVSGFAGTSMLVPSGHCYAMPGHIIEHETVYQPTEGVNRYSIVCFFKLKNAINSVPVSEIIDAYYWRKQ